MKIRSIYFCSLIGFCCACAKGELFNEIDPEYTTPSEDLVEMSFTVSSGKTRAVLDGLDVVWEKNDMVTVIDDRGNRCFVSDASGSSAVFKGSVFKSPSYTLLYPYDEDAMIEDGLLVTEVPSVQAPVVGTFDENANLAVAEISGNETSAVMRNAVSLISFTLPESDYDILSVTIESRSGDCLSGPVTIDVAEPEPATQPAPEAFDYVSLSSSSYFKAGEYYVAAIPGNHSFGFRMKIFLYNDDYLYKNFDDPAKLKRNEILDFGQLDLSEFIFVQNGVSDNTPDPVSVYASYGVDYSRLSERKHPYILINNEEFDQLRRRVVEECSENDDLYIFHKEIMKRAATVSRKTSTLTYYIDENGNLLDVANEALERLVSAAYCYKITGQESYLQKVKTDLAAVCNFQDWDPHDMMSVAEMSTGVAIAYDWLYHELTLEERMMVEQALYEKSLVPFSKYTPRTDSNWNQSTCGGAILAAAAVYNKFRSMSGATIDKCITSNKKAVYNIFYPYGCGKEGPGYTDYTLVFEGLILQALKNLFGTCCDIEKTVGLEETGEWYKFIMGPVATFNFSDASTEALSSSLASVFLSSFYDRPDILLREKAVISKTGGYSNSRFVPFAAIWLYKNPFTSQQASYPTDHVWSCQGASPMVLTRNGWTYDETDSYVGLKAAGGYSSHSHLDGGSFVYDAHGYRWSSDIKMGKYAGYKKDIYDINGMSLFSYKYQYSLRWDILCQSSYFHSTLSFTWSDGSVEKLHVTDQITYKPCSVVETYISGEGGYGGKVDLTDHYYDAAKKVHRSTRLLGSDLIVIDEITSQMGHDAPFEWRMVTKADAVVEDGYIKLTQGDKTIYLYCEASGDVSVQPVYGVEQEIVRPSTWEPRGWDSYQSYEGFHVVKFSAAVAKGEKTATFNTYLTTEKP